MNGTNIGKISRNGKPAVLLIAPETGRLPEDMGPLAGYISGKSGGLGEVIAALCEGLTQRRIECHLATLNLRKRFQKENGLDEEQWRHLRHTLDPRRIHLVNSSLFDNLASAYDGNIILNAAEFQRTLINSIIVGIRARNGGKLIIHSHDWMAGGAVTAYAKMSGCPVLHTIHNTHTGHIPLKMLFGVDTDQLQPYIYYSRDEVEKCIDCQATAIKNASLVTCVGKRFVRELVEDHFIDQSVIGASIRNEVKAKFAHGAAVPILNAPSPRIYPECCEHIVRSFGPDDDIISAKKENLTEFQRRTGLLVNPEAILLYWPSRLDPVQKGIQLLEHIAHKFVIAHGDAQIAIIGDGVNHDRTHEEICGRIAWSSGGKIAYQRFNEGLSMLGFAAAADVFGASLYEPCGQIDQVGNLYGATATNRDTGGYHDKIVELTLKEDGAPEDGGNGFLFRDYDAGGLWYALEKSVAFHRRPREVRERQAKRIMKETREKYNLHRMVDQYVDLYERLNNGTASAERRREEKAPSHEDRTAP